MASVAAQTSVKLYVHSSMVKSHATPHSATMGLRLWQSSAESKEGLSEDESLVSLGEFRAAMNNLGAVLCALVAMGGEGDTDEGLSPELSAKRRAGLFRYLQCLLGFRPEVSVGFLSGLDVLSLAHTLRGLQVTAETSVDDEAAVDDVVRKAANQSRRAVVERLMAAMSEVTRPIREDEVLPAHQQMLRFRQELSTIAKCISMAAEATSAAEAERLGKIVQTTLLPKISMTFTAQRASDGGVVDVVPIRSLLELLWAIAPAMGPTVGAKTAHFAAIRASVERLRLLATSNNEDEEKESQRKVLMSNEASTALDTFWPNAAHAADLSASLAYHTLIRPPDNATDSYSTEFLLPDHSLALLRSLSNTMTVGTLILLDGGRLFDEVMGGAAIDEGAGDSGSGRGVGAGSSLEFGDDAWRQVMHLPELQDNSHKGGATPGGRDSTRASLLAPCRFAASPSSPWTPNIGTPSRVGTTTAARRGSESVGSKRQRSDTTEDSKAHGPTSALPAAALESSPDKRAEGDVTKKIRFEEEVRSSTEGSSAMKGNGDNSTKPGIPPTMGGPTMFPSFGSGAAVPSFLLGPTAVTASVFSKTGNRLLSLGAQSGNNKGASILGGAATGIGSLLSSSASIMPLPPSAVPQTLGGGGVLSQPSESLFPLDAVLGLGGSSGGASMLGRRGIGLTDTWGVSAAGVPGVGVLSTTARVPTPPSLVPPKRHSITFEGPNGVPDSYRKAINELISQGATPSWITPVLATITCSCCGLLPLQGPLSYSQTYETLVGATAPLHATRIGSFGGGPAVVTSTSLSGHGAAGGRGILHSPGALLSPPVGGSGIIPSPTPGIMVTPSIQGAPPPPKDSSAIIAKHFNVNASLPSCLRYQCCGSFVCSKCADLNVCPICGENELFPENVHQRAISWIQAAAGPKTVKGNKLPSLVYLAEVAISNQSNSDEDILHILFKNETSSEGDDNAGPAGQLLQRADTEIVRAKMVYATVQMLDLLLS